MKRNFLAVFAVVLALVASSFTVKKVVNVYFIHLTGDQRDPDNYTRQSPGAPSIVPGGTVLNWFKVVDNNGSVTTPEFLVAFDSYDTNVNGTLNDQTEITGSLDKK